MKTAISLPDPLFQAAEKAAKELGVSRSKLMQQALEDFLQKRKDATIIEAINRAVARDGGLDKQDELWIAQSTRLVMDQLKDDVWDEK